MATPVLSSNAETTESYPIDKRMKQKIKNKRRNPSTNETEKGGRVPVKGMRKERRSKRKRRTDPKIPSEGTGTSITPREPRGLRSRPRTRYDPSLVALSPPKALGSHRFGA